MKENKGFSIVCFLLAASFFITLYADKDDDSVLPLLFIPVAFISWLLLFGIAIFRIIKRTYLPWKNRIVPLYLLFLPFGFIILSGICISLVVHRQDWLLVERYDFTGSDNMLFGKDGEYQYWRGSPLGRSAVVRGRYERRDSLLIIQPNSDVTMQTVAKIAFRPYLPFQQRKNSIVRLVALDSLGTQQAIFRIKERTE
jgi:hypothetical protein